VALNELNVQRRVILSGTPIQNDLSEYFSLLNFANPGLLGSTAEFRKNYEIPILRGRDSEASEQDQETSNQKLTELSGVVSKFIIRRTNDILSKYRKLCFMAEFLIVLEITALSFLLYCSSAIHSANQIRACCVLQTVIVPVESVQALYQFQIDSETAARTGIAASQGDRTAQETLQPSRPIGSTGRPRGL